MFKTSIPIQGVLAFSLALCGPVLGQVDLPDRSSGAKSGPGMRGPRTGDRAASMICTVCGTPNRRVQLQRDAANGFQDAHCEVCQRTQLHRHANPGSGTPGALDLPSRASQSSEGLLAGPRAESPDLALSAPLGSAGTDAALNRAAMSILSELDKVTKVDDPVALHAVETLLSLGEPGIAAARLALSSDWSPRLITGLRVLLRSDRPEHAEFVARRLRARMPARVGAIAVNELVALDPVRATPRLLCELLEHPQAPVRQASMRALMAQIGPDLVPLLAQTLTAKNGDSRMKAVELLGNIADPRVSELLLAVIDDPRPRVVRRVIEELAIIDDPHLSDELLRMAFGDRRVLRSGACALLAIVEREDRQLEKILHAGHISHLLRGSESSDPFVSGSCAAALAGIGFRSEHPEASPWLDRTVPTRLVEVVSGYRFFDDYEALREPALRRLKQITGMPFGSNGPAWADWWIEQRDEFHASRAVLPVPSSAERSLRVAIRDNAGGRAFALIGPDLAARGASSRDGEVFFLGQAEALDVLEFLVVRGVLGADCLPGVRGSQADLGRVLEVSLGDQAKAFVFGVDATEPWFEQVLSFCEEQRKQSLWQRYPHPERHGSRLALWRSEGAWWGGDHDLATRQARLRSLVFDRLLALAPAQRVDDLRALEDIYHGDGPGGLEDLEPLMTMLSEELYYAGRAQSIIALAREVLGIPSGTVASAPMDEAVRARGWHLAEILQERFGSDAMQDVVEIVCHLGGDAVERAARDARPLFRAVAAFALVRHGEEVDLELLLPLFDDRAVDVQIAAVQASGDARLAVTRKQVLMAAGLGLPDVRVPALRAAGQIGGDGAREVLITALTDPDGRLHQPAAEGLAALRDPQVIPLMLSLLRSGERQGAFPAVRQGLYELGELAWDDLFMAMRSPSPELRREAALILSRQAVPGAAPALMRALAEDPLDTQVARELCVLTCVDQRGEADPAEAWFRWWDGVLHDDSTAWLRAAGEAFGVPAPGADAFVGSGTRPAVAFLVELMSRGEIWLVECARRELVRLTEQPIKAPPPPGAERDQWLLSLLDRLEKAR